MRRRDDKIARAAHIKERTHGTSNEISFSVLDAAKYKETTRRFSLRDLLADRRDTNTQSVSRETDEHVSRETSTDDDGNEKETTTYQLNGKEIESTTFTTFYNKLINMAGQKRLTDAYTPAADPEMTAVFTDSDKNQTTVTFYTYDTNYYAAVVGDKVFLVNKMTVKEMFNAYETMVNGETETEATATPTAEAEKKNIKKINKNTSEIRKQ